MPEQINYRRKLLVLACSECHAEFTLNLNIPPNVSVEAAKIKFTCRICSKQQVAAVPPRVDRCQHDPEMRRGNSFEDKLRTILGGDELARKAYGEFKARRPQRRTPTPAWVLDDDKLELFARQLSTDTRGRHKGFKPERTIAVLNMYYRMGLSSSEIANQDLSVAAVKSLIRRTKRRGNRLFAKRTTR